MNIHSTKLGGGEIVAVLDNTTVVVNRGLLHNIEYNDMLSVSAGNETNLRITVRVVILEEFYCVAKLENQTPVIKNVLCAISKRLLLECYKKDGGKRNE